MQAECAFILLVVPETQELFCEIGKSEGWEHCGEQIKAECAFILLVVPETQALFCLLRLR